MEEFQKENLYQDVIHHTSRMTAGVAEHLANLIITRN